MTLLLAPACADTGDEDEDYADSDIEFRPPPARVCTGCTFKMATFSAVPTSGIVSASIKVLVTHSGACPQRLYPDNCTETLTYDVKCALGSSSMVTLPILIDAADSNNNRSATMTVKLSSGSTQTITGSLNTGSGTTTLPATPCPPPTVDPYVTLPDVL
jgi:hypothetical protein